MRIFPHFLKKPLTFQQKPAIIKLQTKKEVDNMNFGLDLNNGRTVLIDVSTGEILAEDRDSIRMWLNAYEDNFTLTLI